MQQIKKKKQLWDSPRNKEENIAQEVIKCGDELTIANYDVDFEEEGPDLRMLGGIRGIRALKVQRDYLPDVEDEKAKVPEPTHNRFEQYEK